MKRRSLIAVFLVLVAVALVVLGYCSWNASIRRDRAELPRYGSAPEFDLKDQNDLSLSKESLRGTIWVTGFIDVADPGASALINSRFAELDQNFRKAEQLTLLSMVVATRQSEPKLADLSRRYFASSHWHFVTGTAKEIHDLLDRWKRIVSVQADSDVTSHFFLADSEGAIRGVYDGRSPEAVQRILGDIGTLLRTGPK